MAAFVGEHPSTISRELRRAGSFGTRSPRVAHGTRWRSWVSVKYSAKCHSVRLRARPADPRLGGWVMRHCGKRSGSCCGRLVAGADRGDAAGVVPRDLRMRVSHETIYQSLFIQTKGELKRELTAHLRSQRQRRKAQTGGAKRVTLGITDEIRISARPAEADDRAVPGHWEGDLLLGGTGKGAVITLVERSSRFVLLAPLPGRHIVEIGRRKLSEMIATLPLELRKSITWDRGREMAQRARFNRDRGPDLLLRPQAPWQRGTNENTHGLLRQYWPKGADLRQLTDPECDAVALQLNTRPRKTLQWQTPGQALNKRLVAIAV